MNKKIISVTSAALLALPGFILAFSAGSIPTSNATLTIGGLVDILFSILWPVAVAFFIVMFVIAGFMFATSNGDPDKTAQARGAVIYGAVGVVVALVAFSIVFVLRNLVGV